MVNIKKDDVDFLKKFVFKEEPEKLEKLIASDISDDLLIELNDWLAFEGFDKNYNLNKIELRVQEIYDYVYINKETKNQLQNYMTVVTDAVATFSMLENK